jgi:OmpA-OmpF porin, OOP family
MFIKILGLSLLFVGFSSWAEAKPGYLTDRSGNVIRNGQGQCWTSHSWTPDNAAEACHPGFAGMRQERPQASPAQGAHQSPMRSLQVRPTFGFNETDLQPQDRQTLSRVAEQAQQTRNSQVLVTGYADRIGTNEVNQRISEARAQETKNFLVAQGVPAARIEAQGRGSSNSVVGGQCREMSGDRLIECLAEDRRVEVQVQAR